MEVDPRLDHSLRMPRPDLSVRLGTPNACSRCHLDKGKLNPAKAAKLEEYADWLPRRATATRTCAMRWSGVDRWCADKFREWYGEKDRRADALRPYADGRAAGMRWLKVVC